MKATENNVTENNVTSGSRPFVFMGILAGLIAAVGYGFIPTFTLPLLRVPASELMSEASILCYRFLIAAAAIALLMLLLRKSFRVTRGELVTLTYLAFLSDGSALFLLAGYKYMGSGVATVLHFMYPVFTALVMMAFYHESRKVSTMLAVLMAVAGVTVLSWPREGEMASIRGIVIVLISALCYALYLIRVNRSRAQTMDVMKLTFYILFIGAVIFGGYGLLQDDFQPVATSDQFVYLLLLGIVCTAVTNLGLVISVQRIGSTMTSVLGALEPLTAVGLGIVLWQEDFTWQVAVGLLLIIPAVVLIILTRGRKRQTKESETAFANKENQE